MKKLDKPFFRDNKTPQSFFEIEDTFFGKKQAPKSEEASQEGESEKSTFFTSAQPLNPYDPIYKISDSDRANFDAEEKKERLWRLVRYVRSRRAWVPSLGKPFSQDNEAATLESGAMKYVSTEGLNVFASWSKRRSHIARYLQACSDNSREIDADFQSELEALEKGKFRNLSDENISKKAERLMDKNLGKKKRQKDREQRQQKAQLARVSRPAKPSFFRSLFGKSGSSNESSSTARLGSTVSSSDNSTGKPKANPRYLRILEIYEELYAEDKSNFANEHVLYKFPPKR